MKKLLFILSTCLISILGNIPVPASAQNTEPIRIEIPDVVINNTTFKRKSEFLEMNYNQYKKHLILNWVVSYYADSLGFYGPPISLNGVTSYVKQSIADNNIMVNPDTGAFVQKDEEGNYPPGSIGQYDYFYRLGEHADINVHNLIRAYGAAVTNW